MNYLVKNRSNLSEVTFDFVSNEKSKIKNAKNSLWIYAMLLLEFYDKNLLNTIC